MPELPEKLTDDQQDSYTLIVLVTGKYLDEHTNQERTNILFEADDAPDLDRSLLSKDLLTKALAELLHDVLKGDLKTTNVEKILQIERFIEELLSIGC